MASTISAGTTSGTAIAIAGDTSGVLQLQTNGTTAAVSISTGQQVQVHTGGSASAPVISKSDDTNTGIFFPAADTIAFAEGGTEQMRLTSAGDLQMNSGYGSVATAYGCRAWVNFNGTGTVAIRGSGNVSSITDNGSGNYTVNLTTAMPNANYSAVAIGTEAQTRVSDGVAPTTSAVNIKTNATDSPYISVAIFR